MKKSWYKGVKQTQGFSNADVEVIDGLELK